MKYIEFIIIQNGGKNPAGPRSTGDSLNLSFAKENNFWKSPLNVFVNKVKSPRSAATESASSIPTRL